MTTTTAMRREMLRVVSVQNAEKDAEEDAEDAEDDGFDDSRETGVS